MDRKLPLRRGLGCLALIPWSALAAACLAAEPPASQPAQSAEFAGQSVEDLAQGKHVATNCSVTWKGPDGKLYCFSDADSRARFLKDPTSTLERAREFAAATDSAATAQQMHHFRSDDVSSFIEEHIKHEADAHGGVFPLHDAQGGQDLQLVFEKTDFMRTLAGYGFFPEVIFHAKDIEAKKYLVDFWVQPRKDKSNELALIETRIYKAPKKEGTEWTLVSRLPTPWWWIPASEHPGKSEQTRGWEVMSAIDEYSAHAAPSNGSFKVKDDKTGEELSLDLVGIHQPVRRLEENGRYFACTDFRKQGGGPDEVYDLDFWVDEKNEKMSVNEVRVHKVPQKQGDGTWRQVPRYNFDKWKFDEVP